MLQRRQFDLYNQQFDMNKLSRGNTRKQTRSLLDDQKNKVSEQPSAKKVNHNKSKLVKPKVGTCDSTSLHSRSISLQSQQTSPCLTKKQPISLLKQPFSKSEEETKAEQQDRWQQSPKKPAAWKGELSEYKEDIMSYVLERQREYKIDCCYLHHSHILSAKLRTYLVRHIFKLYDRYDLMRTTLHLAVFYMDQYFTRHPYINDQMEGIASAQACLFIAMKYQEIYPPDLGDWVDRRHKSDVLRLQAKILQTLDFQLAHYTVEHFLKIQMWEKGEDIDDDCSQIGLLADLSLFDLNIRQLSSFQVALAIRALVRGEPAPDHNIGLSVKWMIERNSDSLFWLKRQKYGEQESSII